jgi:radical SAM protein with 4Fe4S-binding SPASM domain
MTVQETLQTLNKQYQVLATVDLDQYPTNQDIGLSWLTKTCQSLHRDSFDSNQRLIFTQTQDWFNADDQQTGIVVHQLQQVLNSVDISNFFVIIVTTNTDLDLESLHKHSTDSVPPTVVKVDGQFTKHSTDNASVYQYSSAEPIKVSLTSLSDREQFLLSQSKTFCIYPWIHLHAYPTGDAYPCCHAEMGVGRVGNARTQTLKQIWNSDQLKQLRQDMLTETPNPACVRCYEQEKSGFFSGRQSANKHHGHHVDRVKNTAPDGSVEQFEMTYWDIRFSNLCNLRCRSCGHIFSSQWYQDQSKIAGKEWKAKNKVLNYAGRTETDMWEQLVPHLDYVEQIYFAGGEPLLMQEHYQILEELDRRGRHDVRLIYNTNFTEIGLKNRTVFDYWKQFHSVAVGASLDAMGPRAEYIRKGTHWNQVEHNRELMLKICPNVDFYISPTLSIMNAHHLPEFHQTWTERGFIKAQDLNVNILQDPMYYRIDIATPEYKKVLQERFEKHLEWLRPKDFLKRATVGFESAIKFMNATDNRAYISEFWQRTHQLDTIRNEHILQVLPELQALQ